VVLQLHEQYAHVLLFRCPGCVRPIAWASASNQKNLEVADGQRFALRCSCGWTGQLAGLAAVKHWVEQWDAALADDGQIGIFEGDVIA
jgi:hypothetical protein